MLDFFPLRRVVLGGALLATVVASVWPRGDDNAAVTVVEPAARGSRTQASADPVESGPLELPVLGEKLERPKAAKKVVDIFAAKSWLPPTPKLAPVAPAAPVAPPFPFTVAGGVTDKDILTVIFANQNQQFVVRTGETFADNYRLDAITASSITVTYLPLGQQQTLPLGTPN